MSRPVWRPSEFILALVAGPMPWNLPTGRASTNAGPISGVMTYWPFGLRWGCKLRQGLVVGDAGGSVEPRDLLDLGADRDRDVPRQRDVLQVLGNVAIGLVERQRLDDRRV